MEEQWVNLAASGVGICVPGVDCGIIGASPRVEGVSDLLRDGGDWVAPRGRRQNGGGVR